MNSVRLDIVQSCSAFRLAEEEIDRLECQALGLWVEQVDRRQEGGVDYSEDLPSAGVSASQLTM